MYVLVKLRKKGILILPKSIREKANITEGDELIVTVEGNRIVLKKFEPIKVRIDRDKLEEILEEEKKLEEDKFKRIIKG